MGSARWWVIILTRLQVRSASGSHAYVRYTVYCPVPSPQTDESTYHYSTKIGLSGSVAGDMERG